MSVLSPLPARIEPLGDSALRIVLGDTLDPASTAASARWPTASRSRSPPAACRG